MYQIINAHNERIQKTQLGFYINSAWIWECKCSPEKINNKLLLVILVLKI